MSDVGDDSMASTEPQKVLVTGGCGYIGRHVVSGLLEEGYKVIVNDLNTASENPLAEYSRIDIFGSQEGIYDRLGCPDACIHLAWRNGFTHNNPSHIHDLSGHFRFIESMLSQGLRNLSVLGTMHEIGYWVGEIDEKTPADPLSFYGIAKNTLRQATKLLAAQYDVPLKWLRAYYITGDDIRNHSIFTKILEFEAEGKKVFPFNSGKNKYDFIDVDLLAKMIVKATMQKNITGEINCCSGIPTALSDKVDSFISEHHLQIRPEYGKFPDRPYDSPAVWGNSDKIKGIMEHD
jgi:dTDP-6-deoxy-L-talose 4-dehydrogenase (NAD+)